ncbi:hypothetical protein AnigIFM50267_008455 [Aspergillus niger]|nr:hypothetical protein AnigIFM50267_008455 [Aspergillus niger]
MKPEFVDGACVYRRPKGHGPPKYIWFYEPKRTKGKSDWKDDSKAAAAPASTKQLAEMPAQHAGDFNDMAESHSDCPTTVDN